MRTMASADKQKNRINTSSLLLLKSISSLTIPAVTIKLFTSSKCHYSIIKACIHK